MTFTLMHQKHPVLTMELDDSYGVILSVNAIHDAQRVPVGISVNNNMADRTELTKWWNRRSIPASRSGLREALEKLNLSVSQELVRECFGLSLSDQYWIKPIHSDMTWETVNFFDNPFSEDIGNILLGGHLDNGQPDMMSPDSTSDGWLKKKWKIIEGKRCLLKGGSPPFYQEPLNEVIASAVMKRLGIPHVPYTLLWDNNTPYSVCEDFIDNRTDLISAHQICGAKPFAEGDDLYDHFRECSRILGIPDVQNSLDRMLVLDYLIVNTDRHYSNFGAVRDAETLEWKGMAPIFDNGTSLWCHTVNAFINPTADAESMTFRKKHKEQMELVQSVDWIDFHALNGVEEEFGELLQTSPYIDEERRSFLCYALQKRAEQLEAIAAEHASGLFMTME